MDKKIKYIQKIAIGTYGKIYKCKYGKNNSVLKIYKCENTTVRNKIIKKNIKYRQKLSKWINVPKIFELYTSKNNLIILEEYAGHDLQSHLSGTWDSSKIKLIKKVINVIHNFPENIPLDTNPYNFTISKAGKIFFVDFIPPDPWEFINSPIERKFFEEIFFTTISAKMREQTRKKRYYSNKYRIIKFFHYLDIKPSKPQ